MSRRFGHRFVTVVMSISLMMISQACEDFLSVDPPDTQILNELVFADDAAASGAMAGVYLEIYGAYNFGGGGANSLTTSAGLSSDELLNHLSVSPDMSQLEDNEVFATNAQVLALWSTMYRSIYQVNAILEGLSTASGVTQVTSRQLRGESLFLRAFCHFYLVNTFGDVPLVVTTEYKGNADIQRTPVEDVYKRIETDLLEAESLLSESYPSPGRVRPNKFTASAMLARYYLYRGDWQRAEDRATNLIGKTGVYSLPTNINSVFLNTSTEAIWQIMPANVFQFTQEGSYFGTSTVEENRLQLAVLDQRILDAFEPDDLRRTNWITSTNFGGALLYFPYKYKRQRNDGQEDTEYSMVLRLAEQYLIRAEARAMQNRLTGVNSAASDIDVIRGRADLDPTTATTQDEIMAAIEQERRLELLTEWGHRWFDLKRWGRATEVLAPIKPNWTQDDVLYPIPQQEMSLNNNLRPQNPGY